MGRSPTVVCVLALAWLLGSGTASAQRGAGFVFSQGFENVFFDGIDPAPPPDLLTVLGGSVTDRSEGFVFVAEYLFKPWLAGGIAYSDGSRATLERRYALVDDPTVTFDIKDGFFDPRVFDLHVTPTWVISEAVEVFGVVGLARWGARSGDTLLTDAADAEEPVVIFRQDNSGWTGTYGGGVTIWARDWIGFRARYGYISMQEAADAERAEVDVRMHTLAWMIALRIR